MISREGAKLHKIEKKTGMRLDTRPPHAGRSG